MDQKAQSIKTRCQSVLENLERNRFEGHYAATREEARALVLSMLNAAGGTVASGESVTLKECGIFDDIRRLPGYLDTAVSDEGLRARRQRESFFADCYLASANAVIEDGRLYFVDGRSNRIAAVAFGPRTVILVAGYNKLCRTAAEAAERVRAVAAPKNCTRLGKNTCCAAQGRCVCSGAEPGLGCASPDRICCSTLILGSSRTPARIKVVLVGEELGY